MEGEVPEIVPSSRKFDLEHPRTLFRIDLKSQARISEAILLTVVHSRKKVGLAKAPILTCMLYQ